MKNNLSKVQKSLLNIVGSLALLGSACMVVAETTASSESPVLANTALAQTALLNNALTKGAPINALSSSASLGKIRFSKRLQHNPFVVPDYVSETGAGSSSGIAGNSLEIRAVLLGRHGSLANVNGTILGVGENIDGYELISVEEGRVVFIKRGHEVVLNVGKDDSIADVGY